MSYESNAVHSWLYQSFCCSVILGFVVCSSVHPASAEELAKEQEAESLEVAWTPPCDLVPLPFHEGPLARRLATARNAECISWAGLPIEIGCAVSDMGLIRPLREPGGFASAAIKDLQSLGVVQEVTHRVLPSRGSLASPGLPKTGGKTGSVLCIPRFAPKEAGARLCGEQRPIQFEGNEDLGQTTARMVQLARARCHMEVQGKPLRIICHECPSIAGSKDLAAVRVWQLESFFLRAGVHRSMLEAGSNLDNHGRFCTTGDLNCTRRNNQCRVTPIEPEEALPKLECDLPFIHFSIENDNLPKKGHDSLTSLATCLGKTKASEARIICNSSSEESDTTDFQRGNRRGEEVRRLLTSLDVQQALFVYSCGGAPLTPSEKDGTCSGLCSTLFQQHSEGCVIRPSND